MSGAVDTSAYREIPKRSPADGRPRSGARCAFQRMSRPRRPNETEMLFATLMEIRHLRVSTQHNDAGHKAIEAFSQLGVTFPVAS